MKRRQRGPKKSSLTRWLRPSVFAPVLSPRRLQFQPLEQRQLLAADAPLADITGLWVTVGEREYFTSEQASVAIDMHAGETLQVTGIRYGLDATFTQNDGVIAFESYVRREHGAADIGSYDYTDGRFADPLEDGHLGGQEFVHGGNPSGWTLDVIDNRVAVVAIRYFADESVVEDRMFIDVNVTLPPDATQWTEVVAPVSGDWEITQNEVAGDSLSQDAGLTVIETDTETSQRFEVAVKAKTVQENTFANGFVVVDYRDQNDFVYAGLRLSDNQWVIGQYDGQFNDLAVLSQDIQPRQVYDLRVAVDGSHLALAADGVLRVSHDFSRPLDQGDVGLANQFAFTHFTDFHVFDNSATLGLTPQEAYEQAVLHAQAALEASTQADDQLSEASAAAQQALTKAADLEDSSTQAAASAERAVNSLNAAVQEIVDIEGTIGQATNEIQLAVSDQQNAAHEIEQFEERLAADELAINDLSRANDAAQRTFSELNQQHAAVEQRADQAVAASEAANATAIRARAASDQAQQAYEDSKGAPKSVQKAAKKAARNADKEADAAERDADEAANEAEEALSDFQQSSQEVAAARHFAELASQALVQAQDSLESTQQSIYAATQRRDRANQAIEQHQLTISEAEQQLLLLRAHVSTLSEQAAQATSQAETAARQAATATADANVAVDTAVAAREEARHLADQLATANQDVATAEQALQEAIAAEQAAAESGNHAYSLNFNHQDDGAFETVAGISDRIAGQLHLTPDQTGLAAAVLDDEALPERTATRLYATVRADALSEFDQNGFVVFDYQSADDFKYAGARADADQWVVGEVRDGEFVDVAVLDEEIGAGPAYELQAWIEGDSVTLLVEGQQKLRHTFDEAIDDGRLGVATDHARSRFDQVAIMQLYGGSGDAGLDQGTSDPAANDAAIEQLF